jgi:hypothetical protein
VAVEEARRAWVVGWSRWAKRRPGRVNDARASAPSDPNSLPPHAQPATSED